MTSNRIMIARIACFVLVALSTVGAAVAQELPCAQVFGGFSMIQAKPGPNLDRVFLPGWNAAVTAYPSSRFGITADFSGFRRTASLDDALVPGTKVKFDQQNYLLGPTIRILRRHRLETSLRGLFGVSRGNPKFPSDLSQPGILPGQTPAAIGTFEKETVFAAAVGSAWDITISRSYGQKSRA